MNHTWKYSIGTLVKSAIQEQNIHAPKMLVIAHLTEEYADYTKRTYLCASYSLGDNKQIIAQEIELLPV